MVKILWADDIKEFDELKGETKLPLAAITDLKLEDVRKTFKVRKFIVMEFKNRPPPFANKVQKPKPSTRANCH